MMFSILQTAKDYMVEYDRRRGMEYSRFHGYTYDGKSIAALYYDYLIVKYKTNDAIPYRPMVVVRLDTK